jgi:chemotaxis protein methyltransferase CheR
MRLIDFDIYKDLLKEKSGLVVTQDKAYLLELRLTPVAAKWNFSSLDMMTADLRAVPEPALIDDIVEAMTTNETSFFRDMRPFDTFRDVVMPYLLQSRIHERKFRIWCAAASSGQEPYSLAMLLQSQKTQFSRWGMEILATDISNDILEAAKRGLYSQFEVQRGLPVQFLLEHFKQIEERWQISDEIKRMVHYKPFNLLDSMAGFGQLDVIFCRNVLIYFSGDLKKDILTRMHATLNPGGYLILGASESLNGLPHLYEMVQCHPGIIYRKK